MSDSFLHLADLTPVESLRLLAEFAESENGRSLQSVGLQIDDGVFGDAVTLLVPEQEEQVHTALIESYGELLSKIPASGPVNGTRLPLAQGLLSILLKPVTADENPLEPTDTYLILAPGKSKKQCAHLFETLRFHATHTKVTAAQTQRGLSFLFLVRDDHQRRSSFQSAVAGEAFAGCTLLSAACVDQYLLFLPEGLVLSGEALHHFGRLLRALPNLFGIRGLNPRRKLLAALIPHAPAGEYSGTQGVDLLYLGGLTFYRQVEFAPPAATYAQLNVFNLVHSKQALLQLRAAVRKSRPLVGYRLELRPARHREPIEAERIRLRERQAELEYRLAYLDSVSQPRPTLMRFTQKQLPALADLIRNLPHRLLRGGALRYGFQATDLEPAGFHFVFVDADEAVTDGLDPLLNWEDLDHRPMRFELDPYWARYYHGKGNACLVFVPEGSVLFPPIHDWEDDRMDAYLRRTMQRWFHGRGDPPAIPDRPLYLFEGPTHPKAHIHITILDREAMQPLHTRLDWINDHLTVARTVGMEPFIQALADDVAREELATRVRGQADAAAEAFDDAAVRAADQIAEKIEALAALLDQESERLTRELFDTIAVVKQRESDLRKLRLLQKDIDKVSDVTARHLGETLDKSDRLSRELKTLELRLSKAMAARKHIGERVIAEVQELRLLHDDLKRRFHKILRLR